MATYYLSPNGNDSGSGTSSSPWYSLQRGYNALSDGDTLLLMDGTYHIHDVRGCSCATGGSLSGGYKTIKAQNKGRAILDGDNIGQYCFDIAGSSSYIKIQNLLFTRWRWYALFANNDQNNKWIWFEGNVVYDSGNIMNVGAPDYLGGGAVFSGRGCSYWMITHNQFYRVGVRGVNGYRVNKDHAWYTQDAPPYTYGMEFSYNLVWQIAGNALDFQTSHSLVVNNTIAWSVSNDYGASCAIVDSSSLASDNIIANNHFYQITNGGPNDTPGTILERADAGRWFILGNMFFGGYSWVFYTGLSFPYWLTNPSTGQPWNNWGQRECNMAETDPKFVHTVKGDWYNVDFHLQPNSPAINKGYPIKMLSYLGEQWVAQNPGWTIPSLIGTPATPPKDLDGVTINGNPDIGCYEFISQSALYLNTAQSAYFWKNDCDSDHIGSRVLFTVPAGVYNSTISQDDADSKAIAAVQAGGQAYANTNGTCIAKPTGTGKKPLVEYFQIGAGGVEYYTVGGVIYKK